MYPLDVSLLYTVGISAKKGPRNTGIQRNATTLFVTKGKIIKKNQFFF